MAYELDRTEKLWSLADYVRKGIDVLDNDKGYIRKMAVDGYIVQLDMSCVAELVKLLRSISSNVNQIARRCNETRNLYAQDVEDLRKGYTHVWEGISGLLDKFEKL